MSGHSKWSTIKHKKAATDKKRADVFSKIAKAITVAASLGGADPQVNYTLRTEIEKAKSLNMPKDKIEKAIKKGSGELQEGVRLETLLLETYGPGNSALLIEAITDNRNRTTSEIKNILSKHGGKFTGEGGVRWMFEQVGVLYLPNEQIKNRDDFELQVIEFGAQDIKLNDEQTVIYTKVENLQSTHKQLDNLGYKEIDSGLEWVAKDEIEISDENRVKLERLYEALDEQEDVQEIYSNTNQ